MDIYDITFIGAGPTGLFGAFYAGMRELRAKIIDALPQPGGQVTALYPDKTIYDIPGFPSIQGKDLVQNLLAQSQRWDPTFALGEQAHTLEPIAFSDEEGDSGWLLETDKRKHYTRTLVIAAGVGAFHPVRLPNESIDAYEGKGVEYFVTDVHRFTDRQVLIIGGGDSAVDWALAIEPLAKNVTLIHRREGFRAHDTSVNALNASGVDVRIHCELRELQGDGKVERAVIFDNRTDQDETIPVDDVIMALGFKADLGPIREWGLDTIGRRYLKVNSKMETNLPGVYAAGDIALQEELDPLNLIVVGYGQVTVAVNYAYARLRPGGKVFPGHSSERLGG